MAKATGAKGTRSRITAAKPAIRKAAAIAEAVDAPLPPPFPRPRGMSADAGVEISEDAFPELDAVAAIQRGLHAYNQEMGGNYDREPVTLLARAPDGTARGGLLGLTFWGWLFIDWLWLSRDLRGKGVGSELLLRAEAIARERGCAHAYTDTFSFQAPDFWLQNGYAEFGRLDGMPAGHARIWFRKAL
ncbi:GNAT family N-acetyltransferase [Falsiroseomonas stagni]|nr:GNAT family N-acetyltransferase [Falsiroseomonas stagni]